MDGTKCGHAAEEGSQYTMPIKCQSPHPVSSCLYLSRALALPNFRLLFSLEVSFQTSYSPKPIPFLIYLHFCCIFPDPSFYQSQGTADSFVRGKEHYHSVFFSHYYLKGLTDNSRPSFQQKWDYSMLKLVLLLSHL